VWLQTILGLMIGFIGLFDTARDYILQFFITDTLVTTVTFSCRCLVVASNGGGFPSSGIPNSPRPQLPASTTTGPQQFSNLITNWPTATADWPCLYLNTEYTEHTGSLLLFTTRCLVTAVVKLFISPSLPSNGSTCHNILKHIALSNREFRD
jgi:hypothetical protein